MYLKRLEVQGFKSFADKIDMQYEGGITGVVGPNGSGKSNISDSIRWVLGEQSPKSLRGSKMEDVIFAGTSSRRPLGMAEVSLTLDNSSHMLPIDYGEVTITRRVYRSGESEYYLNKSSCRLKDIRELLMDTGIGKEGYSIIGQGKIDEILNSKPEERRLIFEEAAGIIKYKTRRDEADKKLNATKENLLRVADILHELENQLEPLKRQSTKAKKFKELKESLLKLEVNLFIREIDKIDQELKQILGQIESISQSLKQQQEIKEQHQQKLAEVKERLNECEAACEKAQGSLHQTENEIKEKEGQISLHREKISNSNTNLKRIEEELLNLEDEDSQVSQTLDKKLRELEETCKELEAMEGHLAEKLKNQEAQIQMNSERERELEGSKGQIIDTLNEISDKKSELNSLRTLMRTMEERIAQVQEEITSQRLRAEEKQKSLGQLNGELEALHSQIKENEKAIEEGQGQDKLLETNLLTKTREVEKLKSEFNHKSSRKNLLEELEREHDGFNKSVKNILTACEKNPSLGKGIHGVVADLIKVPKGYEIAIETALGSAIQNIVSETEADGKRLIDHMKRHNLGRITILPISSLQKRSITPEEQHLIKDFKEVQGAFDIIEADQRFSNVFSNLLSRVLIVPNLEIGIQVARKLQYRLKIVTLEGDQLNIGGSMTGGSSVKASAGILGRKRELEELKGQLQELERQAQACQQQHQAMLREREAIQLKLSQCLTLQQEHRIQEVTLKNRIDQITGELDQIKTHQGQLNNELKQLHDVRESSAEKERKEQTEIEVLDQKIADVQSQINREQRSLQEERLQLEALNDEITREKVRAASVEGNKKNLLQEIQHLQQRLKQNQQQRLKKQDEIEHTRKAQGDLNQGLADNEKELSALQSQLEGLRAELDLLKQNKNEILAEENKVKELLVNHENTMAGLQESTHKLELKRTRLEMQQQSYYNKLWEDYELTYTTAQSHREEIADINQANRDIKKYKDEMRALGNVNLEAIEEYEKVKERYQFLKQQQEDLIQAKESLTEVIKEMEKTMEKQFMEQFQIIRENFNQVFKKLFGGGRADLILEAEGNILNSGIDIIAQPPGKKLQNLSLLSGGERALTAISLLFAILLVKPSPFCILDEIEAALDDANVKRFADFLKELSQSTQFIVVTHRKGTMEIADVLYGVTMEEEGVSKLVSVKLSDKNEVIAS
ncbi:chromosome segregation protein SMC [Alkaliphilus crotonatoxidans]